MGCGSKDWGRVSGSSLRDQVRWSAGMAGLLGGLLGGCGVSPRAEYEAIRATEFAPVQVADGDRLATPAVAMTEFGFDRLAVLAMAPGVTDSGRGD